MAPQLTKSQVESIVKEPIKSFSTKEGSQKGDNVAGNLLALIVQTESGKELNLVYKNLPPGPGSEFIVMNQMFPTEIALYANLVPDLESWAKTRNVKARLPTPKYIGGFSNGENDYIALEDLRSSGYRMADKFLGLNFEEVSLVLSELGKFHALSYSFLQWEGEKLFEKPEYKIFDKPLDMFKSGMGMFTACYDFSADLVGERDPKLKDAILKSTPKSFEDCFGTLLATDKKYFPVIILGDLWVNNILFKYDDDSGLADGVKFIDFQLTRRGNIYEELGYFIFTSTTPEFRKKHLATMLDLYYESFVSTIRALKCHPPSNFTKGNFIDSFVEGYFSSFFYMTFAIPMQLGTPMDDMFGGDPAAAPAMPQPSPPEVSPEEMMEMQMKMMAAGLRASMESCPRALDRLYSIAKEMEGLGVF